MKFRLHAKIGIGLILLGIVPFIFVEFRVHAHNWTPLDMPIVLKPSEIHSTELTADVDGRYLVSLALDQLRGPDLTKEQCMMGVGSRWECGETKQTVEFDWRIISNGGTVIGNGTYEPGSISGAKIGFAEFQSRRGTRQQVVLKVQRDADEVNRRHPRLVVETAPEAWEELVYLDYFSRIWAGIAGVLGLLLILVPGSSRATKKLDGWRIL
jgi:hypothetical protein